jgi:hypothetical protein
VTACDLCGARSGSSAWLVFDARRLHRRPTVRRFIVKLQFCEACLALVFERATPTDRPYTTQVPSREWPRWATRASAVS